MDKAHKRIKGPKWRPESAVFVGPRLLDIGAFTMPLFFRKMPTFSSEEWCISQKLAGADFPGKIGVPIVKQPHAAKSIFVIEGGCCFCCSFPALLALASSSFNSAPTSIAKPVQYNQVIKAMAAPSVP